MVKLFAVFLFHMIINKVKEVEFDELTTLALIEKDTDLRGIFTDEVKLSFPMLGTLSKEGKLSPKTKTIIRDLFDKVILTTDILINQYNFLSPKVERTEQPVVEEATPKKPALPRRFGKANIQEELNKQGGKPTNAQLTALEINDLKNIYINLNKRLINDMLGEKQFFDDEDYREIRSTIKILKNKMRPLLNKKLK